MPSKNEDKRSALYKSVEDNMWAEEMLAEYDRQWLVSHPSSIEFVKATWLLKMKRKINKRVNDLLKDS